MQYWTRVSIVIYIIFLLCFSLEKLVCIKRNIYPFFAHFICTSASAYNNSKTQTLSNPSSLLPWLYHISIAHQLFSEDIFQRNLYCNCTVRIPPFPHVILSCIPQFSLSLGAWCFLTFCFYLSYTLRPHFMVLASVSQKS